MGFSMRIFRRYGISGALSLALMALAFLSSAALGAEEDLPVVTVADVRVTEGQWLEFVAKLDKPMPGPLRGTFEWTIRAGSATPGVDYVDNSYWASFQPGATEYQIDIQTLADPDHIAEGNETLELVMSNPARLRLASTTATGVIQDSNPRPTSGKPEVSILSGVTSQEGGRVIFRIYSDPTPTTPLTVKIDISQSGDFAPADETGTRQVTLDARGQGSIIIHTNDNSANSADGSIIATLLSSSDYTIDGDRGSATVNIVDDDPPSVSISAGPSIAEGETATFTLTASPKPSGSLLVDVDVSDSGDSTASSQTGRRVVTIGSGGEGVLRVSTVGDGVDEADSLITATIVRGHRYSVSGSGADSVQVSDGGVPTPAVTISGGGDITEGKAARFSLTASPAPTSSLTVSVNVTENGRFAGSGQTGKRSVTIGTDGAGSFEVRTVSDGRDEADGRITASLLTGDGYVVGSPSTAEASVTDGGEPTPSISISAGSNVWEGDTAHFYLTATPPPESDLQVAIDVAQSHDGLSYPDHTGRRWATVYTTGWGEVLVLTINDGEDSPDGHITASVAKEGERYSVGSPSSARLDVTDGGAPTPRISIAPGGPINEGGSASFLLTASPHPASPISVEVRVADTGKFAVSGETGSRTVSIGTDGAASFNVATESDSVDEPDGAITASLQSGNGYELVSPTSARVPVSDGGAPTPHVTVFPGADIVEGESASFLLTATPAPKTDISVTIEISDSGEVAAAGETGAKTVTIGVDGAGALSVATTEDANHESGSITATVKDGAGYAIGLPMAASLRVVDGDSPVPLLSIEPGPTVIEGENVAFTLRADPAPAADLTVNLNVSSRDQFAEDSELGARVAIIEAGDSTGLFSVATVDDAIDESHGTISANLVPGAGYGIARPDSASVRVNDNDAEAGDLTVSVADASLVEGDRGSGSRMRFEMTLDRPSTETVRVAYRLRSLPAGSGSASATPGRDFNAAGGFVVFAPGETQAYAEVSIVNDDEDEPLPEIFGLVITEAQGAEIRGGSAVGTILPDPWDVEPGTPVITIAAQPAVAEGERATFTLTATPPAKEDIEIRVTVIDAAEADSGNDDGDFIDASEEGVRTIVFPGIGRQAAVIADGTITFTVRTAVDSVDETSGPVTAVVEPSGDGSYLTGSPSSASVIVYDNDGESESLPALSVSDAEAPESDGRLSFAVSLDNPVPDLGTVTVHYYTWGQTALIGVDFDFTYGELIFSGGESSKSVTVDIVADDIEESAETFTLRLTGPEGASLADNVGTGTILDSRSERSAVLVRFPAAAGAPAAPGGGNIEHGRLGAFAGPPAGACVSTQLRSDVEDYASETWRGERYVERWLRVLQTFSGAANDATIVRLVEAQSYLDQDRNRWSPVVEAINCLEVETARNALSR